MIRNALSIPYSWLVRRRFFVYAWIAVDHYLVGGWFDTLLWSFSGLLAWKLGTGFLRIRARL